MFSAFITWDGTWKRDCWIHPVGFKYQSNTSNRAQLYFQVTCNNNLLLRFVFSVSVTQYHILKTIKDYIIKCKKHATYTADTIKTTVITEMHSMYLLTGELCSDAPVFVDTGQSASEQS